MTSSVATLPSTASLRDGLILVRTRRIHHIPVVDGGRLVGIVSDRDLRKASPSILSGSGSETYDLVLDETPISKIMTKDPMTVTSRTNVEVAVRVMEERRIGAVLVVDQGTLVGVFTVTDALRLLVNFLVPRRAAVG